MTKKIPLGSALAVLFIVIAATIAITMKVSMSVYNNLISDLASRSSMYDGIAKIDEIVRKDFYLDVKSENVNAGSVKGYIEGLGDPASFYLSADEYVTYQNRMQGKMSGTGISCTYNSETDNLYISAVAKNSPAEAAGIKPGDEITKVGDTNVTEENSVELMNNLEGERLASVYVTVKHDSTSKTVNLVMGYSATSVSYRMIGSVGIVSISAFYQNAVSQFDDAMDELQKAGCKAVVFDVRNCSEGSIEYATEILDILVPVATDGTAAMATIIDKNGETIDTYPSDSDCIVLPMLVLINGATKGPAELFACDLRDFGKAELIGTKTAGVCTLQEVRRLSNGDAAVLTVAGIKPYTSESYNGVGLKPNHVVKLTADQTAQIGIMSDADDPHIQKALEIFNID